MGSGSHEDCKSGWTLPSGRAQPGTRGEPTRPVAVPGETLAPVDTTWTPSPRQPNAECHEGQGLAAGHWPGRRRTRRGVPARTAPAARGARQADLRPRPQSPAGGLRDLPATPRLGRAEGRKALYGPMLRIWRRQLPGRYLPWAVLLPFRRGFSALLSGAQFFADWSRD